MASPRFALIFLLFTQILVGPLYSATAPLHYRIIDLGLATPAGLNDRGQVILNTSTDAYLYTSGTFTDLGSLTGSSETLATSINNSGQVALTTYNGPFLYTSGAVQPFPFPPGVISLYTQQINNLGQVAGIFYNVPASDPLFGPFLSTNGTFTDLTPALNTVVDPAFGVQVSRLNDIGQILCTIHDYPTYPNTENFLITGGSAIDLGIDSTPFLNNNGDLAETDTIRLSDNFLPRHAVLIISGDTQDLGVLPGCDASGASDLNDSDDVIGGCTSHSAEQVPFLYTNGRMLDFAQLVPKAYGASFTAFNSLSYINNLKWITGSGTVSGSTHSFLAIPFPGNSTDEGIGDLVVAENDIAPGCGDARFNACGFPSLDPAGDVAFRASLIGGGVSSRNDSGIWLYSGTAGLLVARTSLSPSSGPSELAGAFSKFSDPVIGGSGCLAFFATLQPGTGITTPDNQTGLWNFRDSILTEIARQGDASPGLNESQFSSFQQIAISDSGAVTFSALIRKTSSRPGPITALFSQDLDGDLHLLASTAMPSIVASIIPFRPGAHIAGQPCCFDPGSGNIAILERDAQGFTSIQSFTPGSSGFAPQTLLEQKAPALWLDYPFLPISKIISVGEPRINAAGTVAASVTLDGVITSEKRHEAIVLISGNTGHIVIQEGGPLGTGLLAACGDPAIDASGDVAFFAISGPGYRTVFPRPGVWTSRGGIHPVALEGDPAPGVAGATFVSIDQFMMTDAGDIAIFGTFAGDDRVARTGIWETGTDGNLHLIVKQDDFLYVHGAMKPVVALDIFGSTPITAAQGSGSNHATAELLYKAGFSDGTWALFTASP